MKILITGSAGMLGSDLSEILHKKHELIKPTEKDLDITDRDRTINLIRSTAPGVKKPAFLSAISLQIMSSTVKKTDPILHSITQTQLMRMVKANLPVKISCSGYRVNSIS
jgi:NAD dependent epimerase/dehydratase family enzyme